MSRRGLPGLSPYGSRQVERVGDRALALRRAAGTPEELVCVTNHTPERVVLPRISGRDVLARRLWEPLRLEGLGYAWVRPRGRHG